MQGVRRVTMVIPSYWRPESQPDTEGIEPSLSGEEESLFDHPTPLNEQGTLPRLLDSLETLHDLPPRNAGIFTLVIIAVPTLSRIADQVLAKLEELIHPYRRRYDIRILHAHNLEHLKNELIAEGVSGGACELIGLNNYAAVRNMCSLASILNGSQLALFIDDDEVFIDPDFLREAQEFTGGEWDGRPVRAVAGYYLQPDTYRLDVSKTPAWRRPYWDNASAMNEAFDLIIGRAPRLKPTPFVFGGNMVVECDLLSRIPFDPLITRGEDIDFLINLRANGVTFWLDRELSIKHLPPRSSSPDWKKLREDARRFLYERKKLADHSDLDGLDRQALMPYPGLFLGPDLEERIIKTSLLLKQEYESASRHQEAPECDAIAALAEENPYARIDTKRWLVDLTERWQELTAAAAARGIPP
ncbi:hypothetical protein AMJ39_01435 [candidate division TA06 bacterium DG_24]|uniref:Glycosyltransferase 2-like domain-containing protein n=1 Tax=candidate division TA06 bacterium DG_24 TaxID=1703770 RepID=A0A0S7WXC2_UNCT6|nr:MAG: hypothetical protein AMJ39_01435 [candidate division TA06 bacterium DG_24]